MDGYTVRGVNSGDRFQQQQKNPFVLLEEMFAFRSVKQLNTVARRNFSGHVNVEEVKAEAAKWYKLTLCS